MRVSSDEESTDLPVITDKSKRPNTSHNVFKHFHKDLYCEVCKLTKTARPRKRPEARRDRNHHPLKFGDAVTADHHALSRLQHRYAVKTDAGITTSQPHTYQKPMELPKTQSASQRICLCTSVPGGSFGKVVLRSNGMLLLFAKQMRQIDRQSHRMKQELVHHLTVQSCHFGLPLIVPSLWDTDASMKIQRIWSEFWRRLDQRLDHRGLAGHRELRRVRGSRQKILVQRSRSQDIVRSICISLRRTSNLTPPESREIRHGRNTLYF